MLLFNVVMYLLAVCLNKHQVVFYVQIKCNIVIIIKILSGPIICFSELPSEIYTYFLKIGNERKIISKSSNLSF